MEDDKKMTAEFLEKFLCYCKSRDIGFFDTDEPFEVDKKRVFVNEVDTDYIRDTWPEYLKDSD